MGKKITKIICWTICIAIICVVLYCLSAIYGNPVSSALAKSTAKHHLQENYPDSDFEIVRVGYDMKTGGYYAKVESPTSPDSYFTIYTDGLGRFKHDSSYRIADGTNTFIRLDDAYRSLARSALPSDRMDISMHYGELRTAGVYEIFDYTNEQGERKHYTLTKDYGLDPSALVLDGEYDIHQLGRDHGYIHVTVYDQEVTVQRATELLLQVKAYLDAQDIPFHAVEFHLYQPRNTEGQLVGEPISLFEFLYSEIYEEGLLDRVQLYWNAAQEHSAIQNGEKVNAELEYLEKFEVPQN